MMHSEERVKIVGSRLRGAREGLGLSIRQLAEASGVSASFISRVEAGKASPTVTMLERWLQALNLSMANFFQLVESTPAEQVVFRKDEMRSVHDDGRSWYYAFPPGRSDIPFALTYEEYEPGPIAAEPLRSATDLGGFVVSGTLELVMADGSRHRAGKGDAFFVKAFAPHTSFNVGTGKLKLVVAHGAQWTAESLRPLAMQKIPPVTE